MAVLDSAWFESLLADALDSEQVQVALRKALETEGAEQVVASLFQSGLIDEFVGRLVSEGTVWSLIEAVLASDGAEGFVANPALWHLVDAALGSDGAGQMVSGASLWKLIAKALEGEGAQQLLDSGAVWGLVDTALRSDGAGQLLDSEALWSVIDRALESDGAERLVNSDALWVLIDKALRSDHGARLVGDEALWRLIDRALESEGAARLVENPALWVLVDRALRSEGAAQLVNSRALWVLIDKALESEGAAELVAKLFDVGLSDQFIDRLLTSPAVWRLVDKIAASPAVTAAISQQGLGFADQVGNELRARCRSVDKQIMLAVDRHWPHRSPTSVNGGAKRGQTARPAALLPAAQTSDWTAGAGSTSAPNAQPVAAAAGPGAGQPDRIAPPNQADRPPPDPSSGERSARGSTMRSPADPLKGGSAHQTAPAEAPPFVGVVTRAVSWMLDAVVINVVAIMLGLGVQLILSIFPVTAKFASVLKPIAAGAYVVWACAYFVVFWSLTGQTLGARVTQIRLVTTNAERVKPARAAVRWVGMNLAMIPLFVGFAPILVGRRGFPDWLARTAVLPAPQLSMAEAKRAALRRARDNQGERPPALEPRAEPSASTVVDGRDPSPGSREPVSDPPPS